VLTLKGDVDTAAQRAKVEKAAAAIPVVQQVVNELTVKGQKKDSPGFVHAIAADDDADILRPNCSRGLFATDTRAIQRSSERAAGRCHS